MKSTVKSAAEMSLFFSQGKRINTRYITLLVLDRTQHDHSGRVAVIAGKKIGGAVVRNAAKRRLRAVIHDIGGPWNGVDVAFMAKPLLLNAPYDQVVDACFHALEGYEFFDSASR